MAQEKSEHDVRKQRKCGGPSNRHFGTDSQLHTSHGLTTVGHQTATMGWGLCQPDDLQRATVIIQDNRDNRDNRRHIFESKLCPRDLLPITSPPLYDSG